MEVLGLRALALPGLLRLARALQRAPPRRALLREDLRSGRGHLEKHGERVAYPKTLEYT